MLLPYCSVDTITKRQLFFAAYLTFSSNLMSFNKYGLHNVEQYRSFDLTKVMYKDFLAGDN